MLIEKLKEINTTLDNLISLTKEDIENIKVANHEAVFANMYQKEDLAAKFKKLKSEIDSILVSRNRPIEEIFSPQEEELFNKFRDKLNEFYTLHKKFSKIVISVTNFYNTLMQKIKDTKSLDYSGTTHYDSNLAIKA